ncbi:MAG: hypothetical protein Kow0068_22450 [Marinilabiliales bacterium]
MKSKIVVLFVLLIAVININAQSLTITPNQALDESNLDGSYLIASLTSETYADATVDPANITLNNAPAGTSIDSAVYKNTDTCWIYLSFTGMDFDSDSTHFSITIAGTELTGGSDLTSNELTITAIIEPVTCTIVADSTLEERTLDSRSLSIILANVVFADNIFDMQNFSLNNAPAGLTIDTVIYITINNATLYLDFDGTDFDADSTHFSITIDGQELSDGSNLTSNELTIYTYIEPGYISVTVPYTLYEDSLDKASINISVYNDYFADSILDKTNFTLNNFPAGITIDTIIYSDSVNASLVFAFDGTDFDIDSTHCSITIDGSEFYLGSTYTSNDFTVYANPETAYLEVIPDTLLQENILNGRVLTLELYYESFTDNMLDTANFHLNNCPLGVSIDSIYYIDSINAKVFLAYDGTNFDSDSTHATLTIDGNELLSGNDLTSNEFTIYAINDVLLQAIQEVSDSTEIVMPALVKVPVGNDLVVNASIDYPDSISSTITSDYLVDQMITFANPLSAGDTIIVSYNSTIIDTIIASSGDSSYWLSQALSLSQISLINDTDAVWTFTIRGFSETSDSLYFYLYTAKSGEFNSPSKRILIGENATKLIVYEPITITANPQSETVCSTYPVTFNVTASSNSTLSYQWRHNGTSIAGATSSSYTISSTALNDAGNYDCIVSNLYHSDTSSVANLSILSSPNVNLPDTLNLTTDNVTILAATAGYSSYTWSNGNNTNMITIDGSALGVGTYTYWVEVTDNSNGCTITDTCIVIIGYGLYADSQNSENNISCYPNPAKDIIYIKYYDNAIIEIVNIQGEILLSKKLTGKSTNTKQIDISDLPRGSYIIKIQNDKEIFYSKVIIN